MKAEDVLSLFQLPFPELLYRVLPGPGELGVFGEKLLTTGNPEAVRDRELFSRPGLRPA